MKTKMDFPNINERKPDGISDSGTPYRVLIEVDMLPLLREVENRDDGAVEDTEYNEDLPHVVMQQAILSLKSKRFVVHRLLIVLAFSLP